ncbi:MAG: GHKL domain-containing protein, partial [Deltaproteobacteria bacterium]|nr:GHKL domain-containing protein [Deltaproteobacteria bacterium]
LFQLKNPQREQLGKLLVVDDFTEIDRSTRASAWREVARRIAHEIKNPLTPIQLSTQRIRRKYLEVIDDSEMLDSCTSTIIKEVNGLKKMVNEFSKFARLPEISPSPNNINRILENVSDLFKQGLPPLIKINLTTDPTIPETLLDAEQMKRVFTNLIDNAVAAITGAGKIDLISSYAKELKMVSVKVVDTGSGIPAEMLHRIFDPYVTTKKDGTGLGLAIVQQIISDHDGFIRLQNNDSGTTFTIELPA